MAQRRSIQNAADAAALAGAQELPVSGACVGVCQTNLKAKIEEYSQKNGGHATLTGGAAGKCQVASDTNCYTNPYSASGTPSDQQVEVRLRKSVTTFFAGAAGVVGPFAVSARSVASRTGQTGTVTTATPGSTSTQIIGDVVNTNYSTQYTTVTTPTDSNDNFAYAASTSCSAIKITHGDETFQAGLWSNGGVNTSGAVNTANLVRWTAPGGCTFPGSDFETPSGSPPMSPTLTAVRQNQGGVGIVTAQPDSTHLTVDLITGFANGQTIWIDEGAKEKRRPSRRRAGSAARRSSCPHLLPLRTRPARS